MRFPTERTDGLIVIGRANIDMYVVNPSDNLESAGEFEKSVGGSAANIAVGLSRLGRPVELLSAVSSDPFGRYVKQFLKKHGVGTDLIAEDASGSLTSLAFAERKPANSQVVFYRNNASDLTIDISQVESINFSKRVALIITGTALSGSPSREATLMAIERARWADTPVVFDLDWRPSAWESPALAGLVYRQAARSCEIILGTRDEFDMVMNGTGIESSADDNKIAEHFLNSGSELVVVKRGAKGSVAYVSGSQNWESGVSRAGIYPVEVKKNYGAGDAFAAAMVHGLMEGLSPLEAMRWGAGAAGIVVSNSACAASAPDMDEIQRFINSTKEQL